MRLGALAVRTTIGAVFAGHGMQKLTGWFGGHGLEATAGAFESMGLRPGRRHAVAAGASEALGGALLMLGALTPVASMMLTGVMVTAIRKVHAPKGPWITEGGYEYNAVLIAAVIALADAGPGRPSVDAARFPRMHGPAWALAALAGGAAGSYLVTDGPLNEAAPEPAARPAPTEAPAADEDVVRTGRFTPAGETADTSERH
jgi:putative oxidoreductase